MIRLPDPYTHPNEAPGFIVAGLTSNYPSFVETLPNGRVVEVANEAHYWGITLEYPELYFGEFQLVSNTLLTCAQQGKRLGVLLPHYEDYRVKQDTSTMAMAASQTGSSVVITNYTDSKLPFIGRFVKFTNCTKVYKITSAAKTGSTLTLGIFPNLHRETTISTKPIFNNIIFECYVENLDKFQESFSVDGVFESLRLSLRENIDDN